MKHICLFIFIFNVCFLFVLLILAIYFLSYISQSNVDMDE